LKPTETFKLPKPEKRFLSSMPKKERNIYKKQMINANLTYQENLKKSMKGKEKEAVE
jgi:hypothetical protein